jgi:hypothetical protein
MFAIIYLLGRFIADLFKSRRRLEVENLFLRHQLNIILRRPPQRLRLRGSDRALMVWMTRLWPSLLALARVVQPATILRCAHALGITERCAPASSSPTVRCHYRHPNLGRTASSICSDMIFGKDKRRRPTDQLFNRNWAVRD